MTEYGKLDSFRRQSLDRQSVLLQLNIADDYFKAKKQISILEEELQGKEKELYDLKHELISAQIKLENAEKQGKELQKQLNEDTWEQRKWKDVVEISPETVNPTTANIIIRKKSVHRTGHSKTRRIKP